MEKPRARAATARPIRPRPPTRPMVLPWTPAPTRWFDCDPGKMPARTARSPSTRRRATASSRAKCMSAVNSTASAGTTVTVMRRAVAAATSILSGVIDIDAIARKEGFAAITSRSMGSCSRLNRISQARAPAISLSLAMTRLPSGLTVTSAMVRSRVSALSATGWVTKTRTITQSTARSRRRRRPRPARRPESSAWHRARRAPWECRARAQATPDARSSRRARRPRRRHWAALG